MCSGRAGSGRPAAEYQCAAAAAMKRLKCIKLGSKSGVLFCNLQAKGACEPKY